MALTRLIGSGSAGAKTVIHGDLMICRLRATGRRLMILRLQGVSTCKAFLLCKAFSFEGSRGTILLTLSRKLGSILGM